MSEARLRYRKTGSFVSSASLRSEGKGLVDGYSGRRLRRLEGPGPRRESPPTGSRDLSSLGRPTYLFSGVGDSPFCFLFKPHHRSSTTRTPPLPFRPFSVFVLVLTPGFVPRSHTSLLRLGPYVLSSTTRLPKKGRSHSLLSLKDIDDSLYMNYSPF